MKVNVENRRKAVLAMEFLARNINDEQIFESWLLCGVADGDITYGNLTDVSEVDDYYVADENFNELVELFLRLMRRAEKSGGLWFDFGTII